MTSFAATTVLLSLALSTFAAIAVEDDAAYAAELAQRRSEDQARRAQTEAIARKANEDQQKAEAGHEARMAKLKQECGADFQQPKVGMTFERAQRCVGDFKLYAQNGSSSVYQAGRLHVTVASGRIVRWVAF